ncbi:hypothetical protein AVEN_55585-1, partial [Araneus ventricosus]
AFTCSGFETKDSDFDSDHHAADIRPVWLVGIVNQIVATWGFTASGVYEHVQPRTLSLLPFYFQFVYTRFLR